MPKKKVTREQQMVIAKEPRVGISVQYISNMGIIDTLVSMVTQKAKRHSLLTGNMEPKLCN
jgi:hypothetical protein